MYFWQAADPVAEFFRRLQGWVGAPQTGVWDEATHNALSAKLVAMGGTRMALPPWGTPQTAWTTEQAATLNKLADFAVGVATLIANLPMEGDLAHDMDIAAMLASFGLPTTSYADLRAVVEPALPQITDVMVHVRHAATKAMTDAATPWYKRTSTYLIAGGVVLAGVLAWMALRKSPPSADIMPSKKE